MVIRNGNALVCAELFFLWKEELDVWFMSVVKAAFLCCAGLPHPRLLKKRMGNSCCHVFHYHKVTKVEVFLHLIRNQAIQA
jgi:hypothetical protein